MRLGQLLLANLVTRYTLAILGLRQLHIDDSGIEDVDEVLILVNILIDALNVEVLVLLLW